MVEVDFREKVKVWDTNMKVICIKMDDVSGVEKRNEAWILRNTLNQAANTEKPARKLEK